MDDLKKLHIHTAIHSELHMATEQYTHIGWTKHRCCHPITIATFSSSSFHADRPGYRIFSPHIRSAHKINGSNVLAV